MLLLQHLLRRSIDTAHVVLVCKAIAQPRPEQSKGSFPSVRHSGLRRSVGGPCVSIGHAHTRTPSNAHAHAHTATQTRNHTHLLGVFDGSRLAGLTL